MLEYLDKPWHWNDEYEKWAELGKPQEGDDTWGDFWQTVPLANDSNQ